MRLRDRVIVVTGGGRGIGRSIAAACAREGAQVVVAARSEREIEQTAAALGARSRVCDVAKPSEVQALAQWVQAEVGPIYGLVCAAGVYGPIGALETTSLDEWEQAIRINLLGTVACVHAVAGDMKARGEGRIVLLSGGGQGALPNFSSYVASKGAVLRFAETVAAELAPSGIFLNSIAPGAVNTQFLDELLAAGPARAGADAYRRALQQRDEGGQSPDRAADLALYLLSAESRGLYGKVLSAIWDDYPALVNHEALSRSDLYTMRRVVDAEGGTRAK